MQIKFNYSEGNEFTLPDGSNYIGYFNIDDKFNAYTEKYYSNSSILLNSVSEYSADYHKSNHFKDRYVFDVLKLPYTLDEIVIQPNELVNFNVLNSKIKYLHENMIYMYSKMFMGSTDVPVDGSVDTLCSLKNKTTYEWEDKQSNGENYAFDKFSDNTDLRKYSEFDNLKRFVVIPFVDGNGISIIGVSNTHLIGLTSSISQDGALSNPNITLYTDVIDNDSQEKCKNLEDIAFNGRYLYVTDSKINGGGQIFKYDVSSYYTNDSIFDAKRFLIEPIGGYGNYLRGAKFNGCSILEATEDRIWVYDSGNNAIKIYDPNFVTKRVIKINNVGGIYTVLDIRYRKMNDHMYVLYQRRRVVAIINGEELAVVRRGMFEYDSNGVLLHNHLFSDSFGNYAKESSFYRMAISEQDSNVFYLITENNIYKKFFSTPSSSFAYFDRDLYYPNNTNNLKDFSIKDIFILSNNKNKDDLFFVGPSYISRMNERTDYLTVLRNITIPYYNYERIKFEGIEYNQSIVLNKEFFKLFANIIQFKNTLKGRFYAEFNNYSDLMYKDYIYLSDEEINTLNIELEYNSFINDNELVQPNVINRLFKKVYGLQEKLLSLTNVKLKNLKTFVDTTNDPQEIKPFNIS